VGIEAGATWKDSVITSYRDHCTHLGRGGTVLEVMGGAPLPFLFMQYLLLIFNSWYWHGSRHTQRGAFIAACLTPAVRISK